MPKRTGPNVSAAVLNQRESGSRDGLDYFPTPPWATRAFLPFLAALDPMIETAAIWEPASGGGHMAAVLAETGAHVRASDIARYDWPWWRRGSPAGLVSRWNELLDFAAYDGDSGCDWVITNPPFNKALDFALNGLRVADVGVALLVRTNWAEGGERYERLFKPHPPRLILQYSERVAMTKDRWDPDATTATSYAWFIWLQNHSGPTEFAWIPPGQKARLHRREDVERFCDQADAPLFGDTAP